MNDDLSQGYGDRLSQRGRIAILAASVVYFGFLVLLIKRTLNSPTLEAGVLLSVWAGAGIIGAIAGARRFQHLHRRGPAPTHNQDR